MPLCRWQPMLADCPLHGEHIEFGGQGCLNHLEDISLLVKGQVHSDLACCDLKCVCREYIQFCLHSKIDLLDFNGQRSRPPQLPGGGGGVCRLHWLAEAYNCSFVFSQI